MRIWESYTLADLPVVAKEMLASLQDAPRVWLFRGQMGAGKTTLSKELLKQLGIDQNVQSPTFSLVNEYQTNAGETVYHFDLYRLKNIQEALAIGIEEYLDSGNYCLIEWPEQAEELWDFPHVNVEIEAINETQRKLTLSW
ncbi:tRNA (adenosine(37)-N6)-threonylcarbamoyltransferase complex ATPase subunit type 1 TsaE [Aquirufa echingensis]|jgi:tRNA threonylcarbamoyladenosine biosynthesis protein TsaE|uniref:tRNA threonylcarbamoyladenosine biosynthesis protein TsaE n=1 Tax=Aquirufa echingensis TaxID=3096516 RepID=A0ABW6D4P7_9BACT